MVRMAIMRLMGGAVSLARAVGLLRARFPGQPLFRRFGDEGGIMIGGIAMTSSTGWEMHPDGDETLTLLTGRVSVVLETGAGEEIIPLSPMRACIVPAGAWHRMIIHEPSEVIFVTPAEQTRHRPYEGNTPAR